MKKITQSDKDFLSKRLNEYRKCGIVSCNTKEVEQEMFEIFVKRRSNGSNKRLAIDETLNDVAIKYCALILYDGEENYEDHLRDKTKTRRYEKPCSLVSTIILIQILMLVNFWLMNTFNVVQISLSNIIFAQTVPTITNLIIFLYVFVDIKKDKNYNSNDELMYYSEMQKFHVLYVIFFLPIFRILDLLTRKKRNR